MGEVGEWHVELLEKLRSMFRSRTSVMEMSPVFGELPPVDTPGLLETYARELAASRRMTLPMALPLALGIASGSTEGGYSVRARSEEASWFEVPLVFWSMILSGSGVGKSTIKKDGERILTVALEAARVARMEWIAAQDDAKQAAIESTLAGADQWDLVHTAAICPLTVLRTGTQEAIRNGYAENGSHQMILSAESDVFAELTRYSKEGRDTAVPLSTMLDGYDGENIGVRRVSSAAGAITAHEVSLPMVVYTQPATFAGMNNTAFTDQGMFGRMFILSGSEDASSKSSPLDWSFEGPSVTESLGSPLAAAENAMAAACSQIARRGAPVRAAKAVADQHRREMVKPNNETYRAAMRVNFRYPTPERLVVGKDGWEAYKRVQHVRAELMAMVKSAEEDADGDEGTAMFAVAMLARFTSHVLRIAALVTLVDNPKATELPGAVIEDVACRWMPWLLFHWTTVFALRTPDALARDVAEAMRNNPKGQDRTPEGLVLLSYVRLVKDRYHQSLTDGAPGPTVPAGELLRRTQKMLSPTQEVAASKLYDWEALRGVMFGLVEGGFMEVVSGSLKKGKQAKVRLTNAGVARARGL